MATVEHSAEHLMERIIRDAKIPKGSSYREAAVLLGMVDSELRSLVVDQVARASGEYLVHYVDVPLVPGRRAYRQPARAIRLKEVERLDASGNALPFVAIDSANAKDWKGSGRHYYFEDNAFVPLLEPGASGGSFRIRYYRWPSRMVLTTECARIESIPDVKIVSTPQDEFQGLSTLVDMIKGSAPFETLGDDLTYEDSESDADVVLVTLSGVPDGTEAGDYLCRTGTSCFPQLPLVFHDALVELVVSRVLREMRDTAGSLAAKASATEKLAAALNVTSPRAKTDKAITGGPWFK